MIGNRIRKLREQQEINQQDLAKYLKVAKSTLSQYETGARIPNDDIKKTLASFFNVSIDYLLGLTDIPDTIDNYIAKQKKTGTQPVDNQYSADERKIIEMYRQLSEKDKGKIEGRIEEMLENEQIATKGA